MNFKFTNEHSISRIDEIVSYLLGPRLWIPQKDYPDFLDWANKIYYELKMGGKRVMVALSHNEVIGVTIYQQHKKHKDTLEIKNLTVRPDQQGRYVASFLLRNSEIEGVKELNSRFILCDAKAKNIAVRSFLFSHHYQIINKIDLYKLKAGDDLIYRKNLRNLPS